MKFFKFLRRLFCRKPDVQPIVSNHVRIIELIRKLFECQIQSGRYVEINKYEGFSVWETRSYVIDYSRFLRADLVRIFPIASNISVMEYVDQNFQYSGLLNFNDLSFSPDHQVPLLKELEQLANEQQAVAHSYWC